MCAAATSIAGAYFKSMSASIAGGFIGVGGLAALVTAFLVDHNARKEDVDQPSGPAASPPVPAKKKDN
jgi:hypothetical protein